MMDASYELDVLIAEKVMGWYRRTPAPTNPRSQKHWYRPNSTHPIVLPAFSTDIAAAWQVVDHLHKTYDCTVEVKVMASFMPVRYGAIVCGGSLTYARPDLTVYGQSNTSPAHAICLAALKAVAP